MSLSLVWYVFLLLPLFTFTCSGICGSLVVVVCPFFPTFFFARILPFYHLSAFCYTCSIMHTSSEPSRLSGLRIGGRSTEGSDLGQTGRGSGRPSIVVDRVPLAGPLSPHGKGKGKVSEIRYPSGSAYLRATVQNVEAVGPSWVEPSFGHNFASRYKPPFGVRVWFPDFLTSYIVQVPEMVCFFEVAFENGLHFPLHPFIKSVLQHFNVFPDQLSPNFWGVLVGLLVVFRDKGLRVPSIVLPLDFFSVKESEEGFLYIAKCSNAKLIISNLPYSHKHRKEWYFLWEFVIRNIIWLTKKTRLVFRPSRLPPRTSVSFRMHLIRFNLRMS